jgi:hypothetical protein
MSTGPGAFKLAGSAPLAPLRAVLMDQEAGPLGRANRRAALRAVTDAVRE